MGNNPSIVATRANMRAEAQGRKIILTDTAAGKLQFKEHTVIREHQDQVNCVAMSPKGILASSGNDGEIMLFDTKAQKPLALREDKEGLVYAVCFSPHDEGRHVVMASFDKSVRVTNIAAFSHPEQVVNKNEAQSKKVCRLLAHRKAVGCVAYSSDGKYLATGSDDETVIVWDMETTLKTKMQKQLFNVPHPGPVYSVAFSADCQKVFTCCKDKKIRCFWCATGEPVYPGDNTIFDPKNPSHFPLSISTSPDGTLLASGSQDKTIIIWDLTLPNPQPKFAPLKGHTDAVRSVAFSNNSSFLVTGSEDCSMRIWKVLNGDENDEGVPSVSLLCGPILAGTERVNSVCWSPDNNFVVSASFDKTVRVFTFNMPGQVLNTFDAGKDIAKLVFEEDGNVICALDTLGAVIKRFFTTPRAEKKSY
jgi:WD40 repeat protein